MKLQTPVMSRIPLKSSVFKFKALATWLCDIVVDYVRQIYDTGIRNRIQKSRRTR